MVVFGSSKLKMNVYEKEKRRMNTRYRVSLMSQDMIGTGFRFVTK